MLNRVINMILFEIFYGEIGFSLRVDEHVTSLHIERVQYNVILIVRHQNTVLSHFSCLLYIDSIL